MFIGSRRLSLVAASVAPFSLVALAGSSLPVAAQGWGEQAPLQFRYITQGVTNEVYRNQLGAAATSAIAAAAGSGLGGGGQLGSQLNNAVQLNETNTFTVTVTGDNNYLNVSGTKVDAQQNSSGTDQTNTNQAVSGQQNQSIAGQKNQATSGHDAASMYLNN